MPPRFFLRFLRISSTIDSHIYKYLTVATKFTLLHITLRLPTTLSVGQSNRFYRKTVIQIMERSKARRMRLLVLRTLPHSWNMTIGLRFLNTLHNHLISIQLRLQRSTQEVLDTPRKEGRVLEYVSGPLGPQPQQSQALQHFSINALHSSNWGDVNAVHCSDIIYQCWACLRNRVPARPVVGSGVIGRRDGGIRT